MQSSGVRITAGSSTLRYVRQLLCCAPSYWYVSYHDPCSAQVSAKDATNVDPAFGQVAVAAFEHFKEIKAQQEKEYLKSAASAKIDLNASVEGSSASASSSSCC